MAQPPEHTIIHIHLQAPSKPALGAVCNGCGVCCLAEPCPLGIVLSHRRTGACDAVQWDGVLAQYRCGAITAPAQVLARALPLGLRWLANILAPLLRQLGRRWIASGMGCDSSLECEPAISGGAAVELFHGNGSNSGRHVPTDSERP